MRAACVDLTDVLGRGDAGAAAAAALARRPAARAARPRGRSSSCGARGGYPSRGAYRDTHRLTAHRHQAWAVDGAPYDPARARGAGARRRGGLRRPRRRRASRGGGLCVVGVRHRAARRALARGRRSGSRRCSPPPSAPGCGSRRSTTLLAEAEPAPAPPLPVTSWGTPRDLTTWSGPAAGGLAWRQRAAELRARRRGAGRARARAARAARAAVVGLGVPRRRTATAGDYPRERAAATRRRSTPRWSRRASTRRRCATSRRTWPAAPRARESPSMRKFRPPARAFRPGESYALPLQSNQPSPRRPRAEGSGGPKGAERLHGANRRLSAA